MPAKACAQELISTVSRGRPHRAAPHEHHADFLPSTERHFRLVINHVFFKPWPLAADRIVLVFLAITWLSLLQL